jgi:hypothetical protein
LVGEDSSWSYDIQLGGARISSMRSSITYSTDGTEAGTKGSWQLEFFGIRSGSSSVAALTPNGISISGGTPAPGPAGARALSGTVQQLSDLLQKAGAGTLKLSFQPGAIQRGAGKVTVQGAGLTLEVQPKALAGNIGHNAKLLLGYEDRSISFTNADCGSSSQSADNPASTPGPVAPATSGGTPGLDSGAGAVNTGAGSGGVTSPEAPTPGSSPGSSPAVAAPLGGSSPAAPSAALSAPTRLPTSQVPVAGSAALWGRKLYDWALMTLLIGARCLVALFGVVRHLLSRT